jgi:glycosyltransferase involved in cell wall biosynthesis
LIKVGFWYDRPIEYTGGLNYLRNLLVALAAMERPRLQPHVFFGRKVDEGVVRSFEGLATLQRSPILDRGSLPWFLHQVLRRVPGTLAMVDHALRRHGISIVSHGTPGGQVYAPRRPFRVITWIPDFQYLHLPDMFPGLDPAAESESLRRLVARSDAVVVSSEAALADYRTVIGPASPVPVTVLRFVSQPGVTLRTGADLPTRESVEARYGFTGPFFHLPNQFWKHKNHEVALEAVRRLRDRGTRVLLLCTGNPRDYRQVGETYLDGLRRFVAEHGLEDQVRFLGLIDYGDVLFLMRNCVAVLNPSRFEGWSSTVEEARSLGKRVILSSIPVHREQDPPGASFFSPDDPEALAAAMAAAWADPAPAAEAERARRAAETLRERTVAFGEGYTRVVEEVAARSR